MIPAANVSYIQGIFQARLGDPYVYGGVWSPTDVKQGCDCSGLVGTVLEALTNGPETMSWAHVVSTESWYYDYATNTPAAPGTVGPYGTIAVASLADIPADAALTINIMHGGGGVDSHTNCVLLGQIMESNGDSGTCTNGTGGALSTDPEWTDHWYLPGPIEGAQPVTQPTEPADTLWADISQFQPVVTNAYTSATYTDPSNGVTANFQYLSIRSDDGTYQDPNFTANYQWCVQAANAGLLLGFFVYCYYRPGWQNDFNTMQQMVEALGGPHPLMVAMIDVESGGNPDVDESADLNDLYNALVQWLGNDKRVIAYANVGDESVMWQTQPQGLEWILAGYGSNPTPPAGTFKLAHQYTDGTVAAGSLPTGAPPFGNCDMNSADGYTPTALAAALGIQSTPGVFMALTDAQQAQLLAAVLDIQIQLRGLPGPNDANGNPTFTGWPQLGANPLGENLTVVDALADVKDNITLQPTPPAAA